MNYAVTAIQCFRILLKRVGSVGDEQATRILELLYKHLRSPSIEVVEQVSIAIAALVSVHPKITVDLTNTLIARLDAIASASNAKDVAECVAYGNALAAVLPVVSNQELGVPEKVFGQAFALCESLCLNSTASKIGANVQRASVGYCILSSLISSGHLNQPHQRMLPFFNTIKEEKGAKLARWKKLKAPQLALELNGMSRALQALGVYVACSKAHEEDNKKVTTLAIQLTSNTLSLFTEISAIKFSQEGVLGGLQELRLSLVEAFRAIALEAVPKKVKRDFFKLCMVPFMPWNADPPRTSLLRALLNGMDSSLGPWNRGYDDLEDQLHSFQGAGGRPMLRFGDTHTAPLSRVFCYALTTESTYMDRSVWLMRGLFLDLGGKDKVNFIEILVKAMESVRNVGRNERKRFRRETILINASCALISIVNSVKSLGRDAKTQPLTIAKLILPAARILLEEGLDDVALQRASAEIAAGACALGGEGLAKSVVGAIFQADALQSVDDNRGMILWLGAIGRSLGGIALTGLLGSILSKLQHVVTAGVDTQSQMWVLHSYWLIANAAGPSFASSAKQMIGIASQIHILSSARASRMQQTVARIANSVVGVLGPEFTPGSYAFQRCSLLIDGATSSCDAFGVQLEQVLRIQQLLLFAPHVAPMASLLEQLKHFIRSRQPKIRSAAAATLRHVAETAPFALAAEGAERDLVVALDNENVVEIRALLERVLGVLIATGFQESPSKWINFCKNIILNEATQLPQAHDFGHEDDDEEEDGDNGNVGRGGGGGGGGGDQQQQGRSDSDFTTAGSSLETKAFVMECFSSVFDDVGDDPRHWSLQAAQGSPSPGAGAGTGAGGKGDWLVNQLQNLVNAGFKIATGNLQNLHPKGIKFLNLIVGRFGEEEDPDYEGHLLLEQYQAQFLSALRSAFEQTALPTVTIAALDLAANLIGKGIMGSDVMVLKRIVALMSKSIGLYLDSHADLPYSEMIVDRLRVGTVVAFARMVSGPSDDGAKKPVGDRNVNGDSNGDEGEAPQDVVIRMIGQGERTQLSQCCISLSYDALGKLVLTETHGKYSYKPRFVSASYMSKSSFFSDFVSGGAMEWIALLNAALVYKTGGACHDHADFICTALGVLLKQVGFRCDAYDASSIEGILKQASGAFKSLCQCAKDEGTTIHASQLMTVAAGLEKLLSMPRSQDKVEGAQGHVLAMVLTLCSAASQAHLATIDFKSEVLKLACMCVARFCPLEEKENGKGEGEGEGEGGGGPDAADVGAGAAKGNAALAEPCARVWEALLLCAMDSSTYVDASLVESCMQNVLIGVTSSRSDVWRNSFVRVLIRGLKRFEDVLASKSKDPSHPIIASAGLALAASVVRTIDKTHDFSSDNDALHTVYLSVLQTVAKVDLSHQDLRQSGESGESGGRGGEGGRVQAFGIDLAEGVLRRILEDDGCVKAQALLMSMMNRDLTQSAPHVAPGVLDAYAALLGPAIAHRAHEIVGLVRAQASQPIHLSICVECFRFFVVLHQSIKDQNKRQALVEVSLPLLYAAITLPTTTTPGAALGGAAVKLFNHFAAQDAASVRAYILGLGDAEKGLLTKALQSSKNGQASQTQTNGGGGGGRLQPPQLTARIKKPTISLKAFGR